MFLLCLIVISVTAVEAQRRGGSGNLPGRRDMTKRMEQMQKLQAEKQFERLCNHLELDKKQKKKAHKLFDDMWKETEKLTKDMRKGKLDQAAADTTRIDIYKDYRKKFKDLLSEEQKLKYEKTRETGLPTDR